jgi:transcription termination factor Rho
MAKARSPKEKILEVVPTEEEKPKRRSTRAKTAEREEPEKPARRRTAARRDEDSEVESEAPEAAPETPRPVLTPMPSHPVRDEEYQEARAAATHEEPAATPSAPEPAETPWSPR